FDASGELVATLTSGIRAPNNLATDSAGHVFVVSRLNDTVEQFKVLQQTSVSDATTRISVYAAPCYCAGTLIRTDKAEVPVEMLKRGDLVMTTEGVARPISWIGRRAICAGFADPICCWPIRVMAGALGDNVPSRDLRLSTDHALLVEGVLIQAGALVNGTSIVRETSVPENFIYYHVELDDHALILAENAPAETFVDNVDRLGFDNWAEHEALYPDGKTVEEMPFPRAKARRQVPLHIRAALDARAIALGAQARAAVA
ncbi:Hint domain-containing protein, partial [uncultured Rhodoblastus sp.]|uniref:Hint domain-containing protein n=1 Tax=uncultured Rhodoblastus sp. TaxID=543037 RepID=UPI0025D338FA